MAHTLAHKLIHKNFWIYLFAFLISPIAYGIKIILSYDLSVSEIGVIYSMISFLTILAAYNDLGMTDSLNFFIPDSVHNKDARKTTKLLSYAMIAEMISSTTLAVVLTFLSKWLATHYFQNPIVENLMIVFIVYFFMENIFRTLFNFFQALQDTKLQQLCEFFRISWVFLYTLMIWFVGIGNVTLYAWGWCAGMLIGMLFAIFWVIKKYRHLFDFTGGIWDRGLFFPFLRYSMWGMFSANAGVILSQLDMQMVTFFLGSEGAGYYSNYLSIMRIPFIILTPGFAFLLPLISDFYAKKDVENTLKIRNFFYKYFSVFGVITGIFLALYGGELMQLFFGSKFATSGQILIYSCPFLVFNFLLQINFQFLSGQGRPHIKTMILLSAIALNAVSSYFCIRWLGVAGGALASGIGWLYIFCLSFYHLRHIHLSFDWRFALKNIGIFGVLGAALMPWSNFIGLGNLDILLRITLFAGMFLGIFVLANQSDVSEFIAQIRGAIQARKSQKSS